jgi:hypothetical protein
MGKSNYRGKKTFKAESKDSNKSGSKQSPKTEAAKLDDKFHPQSLQSSKQSTFTKVKDRFILQVQKTIKDSSDLVHALTLMEHWDPDPERPQRVVSQEANADAKQAEQTLLDFDWHEDSKEW